MLVTGGAGYVGGALVPKLLRRGHRVTVPDLYIHGEDALESARGYTDLKQIKGDTENPRIDEEALHGCDAVIDLARVSEKRSSESHPDIAKPVNLDTSRPLIRTAETVRYQRSANARNTS